MIKKVAGGYKVLSEKGKNLGEPAKRFASGVSSCMVCAGF